MHKNPIVYFYKINKTADHMEYIEIFKKNTGVWFINIMVVFIYSFIQVIWIIMLLLREMPSRSSTSFRSQVKGHMPLQNELSCSRNIYILEGNSRFSCLYQTRFKNTGKYLRESDIFSEEFMLLLFL